MLPGLDGCCSPILVESGVGDILEAVGVIGAAGSFSFFLHPTVRVAMKSTTMGSSMSDFIHF